MNQAKKKGAAYWMGKALAFLLKALAPILILAGAAALVMYMMRTAPQPERKERPRQARLVDVVIAKQGDEQVTVRAQGTVRPARETAISAQVPGEVIEISPNLAPGGRFAAGEMMLRIDPSDFELAVRERESALTRSRAARTLEKANQEVARREYEVLGEELAPDERGLVLREPQLASAEADVAAAQAMLEDARLDLERTVVRAPFDAQITSENVDLGTRLSTQVTIASLVGTSRYWVELSVAQSDLRWLDLPADGEPGALVELSQPKVWGPGVTRRGHLVRLLPELTQQGRMARLLAEVEDPLSLRPENEGKPRLIVGQYLEAKIAGRTMKNAFPLDRRLLRNGDQVWVMDGDNTLRVRPVEVAYRGLDRVIVAAGLEDGERVVRNDLSAVSEGMPLRVRGQGGSGQGGPGQGMGGGGKHGGQGDQPRGGQ